MPMKATKRQMVSQSAGTRGSITRIATNASGSATSTAANRNAGLISSMIAYAAARCEREAGLSREGISGNFCASLTPAPAARAWSGRLAPPATLTPACEQKDE